MSKFISLLPTMPTLPDSEYESEAWQYECKLSGGLTFIFFHCRMVLAQYNTCQKKDAWSGRLSSCKVARNSPWGLTLAFPPWRMVCACSIIVYWLFQGTAGANRSCILGEDTDKRPPISIKFEIPYFTTSGIQVRYLKIQERSGYAALPWVRYITQNGDYQMRMPDSIKSSKMAPI